jgi:hypothetical protein
MSDTGHVVLGSLLGLLGLGLLVGLMLAVRRRIRFLRGAARAVGRVSSLRASEEESGSEHRPFDRVTVYHSRVTFIGADGSTHAFEQQHGTRKPRFAVGDALPVRYDPRSPAATAEAIWFPGEIAVWMLALAAAAACSLALAWAILRSVGSALPNS